MKEKFKNTSNQEGAEEHFLKNLVKSYDDEQIPLKIRKINLLERVNLPIPETDTINKNNRKEIKEKIVERLHKSNMPLIMRFSGRSDEPGMPSCYIENEKNLDSALKQMEDIFTRDLNVSHVILQRATPKEEISRKVSGRLIMYDDADDRNDEIIELYKGARSTGILNSVDPSDPQFHRLIKPIGGFMRFEKKIDPNSTLNTSEVIDIVQKINEKRDAMKIVQSVLHESKKHSRSDYVFEFSYRDGDLIFTDID